MANQARYLVPQVRQDLGRKMVLMAGPRQVGKTTLALSLPGAQAGYLSWDIASHRERILKQQLPPARLWIFDEIHKYRSWRNWLKGVYDGRRAGQQILVTGIARLDFYRFGGDSLQGRYHLLRLHPFGERIGDPDSGGIAQPLETRRFSGAISERLRSRGPALVARISQSACE